MFYLEQKYVLQITCCATCEATKTNATKYVIRELFASKLYNSINNTRHILIRYAFSCIFHASELPSMLSVVEFPNVCSYHAKTI